MKFITPMSGQKLLRNRAIADALLGAAGPASWSEEDTYRTADQALLIGGALVQAVHRHLETAKIGYLFKEKLAGRGRIRLATARRVSGLVEFFSELDLLVEINWSAWMHLTPTQRVALVDHELCHFGVDFNDKGEKRYVIIPHDVEEFGSIIKRWGLWKEDVAAFAGEVREQLEFLGAQQ